MNNVTRREALKVMAAATSTLALGALPASGASASGRRTSMGIVSYALGLHQKHGWGGRYPGVPPALALLEEAHRLGTGGIMVDLGTKDSGSISELRRRSEQYDMYIEGSIMPPKSADDVTRFEADVRMAQAAGATLARTVLFPGRRYEQFKSMTEFREAEQHARRSLEWAASVLARHKFRLAVENHKDQRIGEKLETLKKVGSEYIGICVDLGNSFTLLEEPLETVRGYAPYAMAVHLKDQAVHETETGFLFADVILGEGFIDLPQAVRILQQANPAIHFGLELITRDALNVPVLTPEYWTTLAEVPAHELARIVRLVRTHSTRKPFPSVSTLPPTKQMAIESRNVERSIAYAGTRLRLT